MKVLAKSFLELLVDRAGNTATASITINLDKTPPVVSGLASPPANANGWNNTLVDVSFNCTDTLSGVASCSDLVSVATEGAGQGISGAVTDLAGNTGHILHYAQH